MSLWCDLQTATRKMFPGRSLGEWGERAAARFLRRRGFRLTARGYTNQIGEIDLIGIDTRSDPRTVVFVEVKTRSSDQFGLPVEAVDLAKQQQISATALVYLKQHDLLECRVRFDVVGILRNGKHRPRIRHYPDAFSPPEKGNLYF